MSAPPTAAITVSSNMYKTGTKIILNNLIGTIKVQNKNNRTISKICSYVCTYKIQMNCCVYMYISYY